MSTTALWVLPGGPVNGLSSPGSTPVWSQPLPLPVLSRPESPVRLSRTTTEQTALELQHLRAVMQLVGGEHGASSKPVTAAARAKGCGNAGGGSPKRRPIGGSGRDSTQSRDALPGRVASNNATVAPVADSSGPSYCESVRDFGRATTYTRDTPSLDVYDDAGTKRFIAAYKFEVGRLSL